MANSEAIEKRNVALAVTGSIAAYKAVELARILVSRGYDVRTIMTASAQKFVTAMTFQSVTGKAVVTDFWEPVDNDSIEHIEIADWADVIAIVPATADVIAKLANGFCDTPLLATTLASKASVIVAPAMNVNMYENPATQENIQKLKSRGVKFVDPEEGALACGWNGQGRLADPDDIFFHIRRALTKHDYSGKRVLISTGPTREPIDPVRFISNRSSGKMGGALAREAFCRGAEVTVVHGPVKALDLPLCIEKVPVVTAQEMHDEMLKRSFNKSQPFDVVIMVAAVSDFKPAQFSDQKIKKNKAMKAIPVVENPDILAALGAKRGKQRSPSLIGFAVETGETEDLIDELRRKMEKKNADIIVGNFANDAFDLDTNRAWLIHKDGRQEEIATASKWRVANKILDAAIKL